MVGRDLGHRRADDAPFPVLLHGGESASGLADMLHQFIEQTLSDSPTKERLARRLAGETIFRAAEDQDVAVRIVFAGDRIELRDVTPGEGRGSPSVTADFLSIAHLTSGRESPFSLLVRRKLRARIAPADLPFLLGMLRFMRIRPEEGGFVPWVRVRGVLIGVGATAGLAALIWYFTSG
jgi:hypothetical protein